LPIAAGRSLSAVRLASSMNLPLDSPSLLPYKHSTFLLTPRSKGVSAVKKILVLVSLLVISASCTNQPATTNTNSNANTTVAKTAPPSEAEMIAKETAVWDLLKKKDYQAFGDVLATDYLEVTDSGVFDKAGITAEIKDFILDDATFSDWKMLPIDDDAVALTYQLNMKGTFKGQPAPPGPYRAAAVWFKRDGKWVAIFFQQTMISTEPPPPPARQPTPGKVEKPSPPKLAETGPDPIANEKIVWETFKNRNLDGFAALLDPAFIELEKTGAYDKAGSVKAIAEMDMSQFAPGDWKALKLDKDAALVTYLITSTNPKWKAARHSTLWINRNGRWLALLHIGTEVAKPQPKGVEKIS
jgi:hypothetical protein